MSYEKQPRLDLAFHFMGYRVLLTFLGCVAVSSALFPFASISLAHVIILHLFLHSRPPSECGPFHVLSSLITSLIQVDTHPLSPAFSRLLSCQRPVIRFFPDARWKLMQEENWPRPGTRRMDCFWTETGVKLCNGPEIGKAIRR